MRNLLGHAGFNQRFIKNFSKIAHSLFKLLEKDVKCIFDDTCHQAFEGLKQNFISAPFIVAPNWTQPFEIMCYMSKVAFTVVLG